MSKKILRIVSPLILFICTVFLAIYYSHTGYSNTEATILGKMIKDMTRNYRMYQIVATTILYFVGYVVVFPLCKQMGEGMRTYWQCLQAMHCGGLLVRYCFF